MNRLAQLVVPVVLTIGVLCCTEREAHAIGPVDIEAGARVGVGTNPDSNGPNPFGIGVGGRAGVSIFNVYGGVSAIHYLGGSSDIPTPVGNVSVDYSSTLLGVEAGYSITAIPSLVLRPQVGIGSAAFSFGALSSSHLYFEPGVVALIPLGLLYVGADANLLVIPGIERGTEDKTFTAFTAHGQIGVRF